ncbi:MAG: class I SAM-dependent methyltransferase [Pseudomonadota bacterium]
MSERVLQMSDPLHQYLVDVAVREHPVLAELREETATMPMGMMQISPDQGQLMAMLVRLTGARRILEVGTFTGYSSLSMALALPDDGSIHALDVSDEYTSVARRHWEKAGVADKISLTLAPAAETLRGFLDDGMAGSFDLMFIDADKESYDAYYEHGLELVRDGGVILVDNVLWGGSVIDHAKQDADTAAIRALNHKLKHDERIDLTMLSIGDGLTLAHKRAS